MPEKNYPPRFDFKKLEPDVPVEFTLLRESRSGKATNEKKEEYEWHLWAVKHTGIEMSLFTPNERVHGGLLYLKVKPGDKFTLTKKASVNTDTGNAFIYYNICSRDNTIDTKDTPPVEPATAPEEGPLADTPLIREPKGDDPIHAFRKYYADIMVIKLQLLATQGINWEKLETAEKLQTLWELDKSTSANVSTILIQGGK